MQYLKKEVEEAIIMTAKEEFLDYGYDKASIKQIAKKINISVGNIYRYFANKEALFNAVVDPAYRNMIKLIEQDHDEAIPNKMVSLVDMIDVLGELLASILADHRKELLILIDGSQGTLYQGAKEHLYNILSEHIKQHVEKVNRGRPRKNGLNTFVARPLAVSFLEGYFEIIRNHEQPDEIKQTTRDYILLYFGGLRELV